MSSIELIPDQTVADFYALGETSFESQFELESRILPEIGELGADDIRLERFGKEQDPDGAGWLPLSEPYATWKAKHSGKPKLRLEDDLLRSISFRVEGGDTVEIGSIDGPVYAGIQNFGGEINNGVIPRREYAGPSVEFLDSIEERLIVEMDGIFTGERANAA